MVTPIMITIKRKCTNREGDQILDAHLSLTSLRCRPYLEPEGSDQPGSCNKKGGYLDLHLRLSTYTSVPLAS